MTASFIGGKGENLIRKHRAWAHALERVEGWRLDQGISRKVPVLKKNKAGNGI